MAFELGTMIVILLGLALAPVVVVIGMLVRHILMRGNFGSGLPWAECHALFFPPTHASQPARGAQGIRMPVSSHWLLTFAAS